MRAGVNAFGFGGNQWACGDGAVAGRRGEGPGNAVGAGDVFLEKMNLYYKFEFPEKGYGSAVVLARATAEGLVRH